MSPFRLALASLLFLTSAPALAEDGKIAMELNDLQQADASCHAVFVLNNGLGKPLDQIVVRVVAFDREQHATKFMSLEIGKLPVGKTRVLRFDLGDKSACADVSRMVLDDVTACAGAGIASGDCLAALSLSSRAGVPLDF